MFETEPDARDPLRPARERFGVVIRPAAGLTHLILCIDGRRQCHDAELPEDARVIRYKSKIDPRAVMAIVGR